MDFNLFMNDIVDAARKDITEAGYEELKTPGEVEKALDREGTTLVMINSTCGCAGELHVLQQQILFILTNDQII